MLTLQPLLENAIYHGIQPLPDGGTIRIELHYRKPLVEIRIINPLPAEEYRAHSKGNKMAVNNIRSRLNVLYDDGADLTTTVEGSVYVTTLRYPFDGEA